MTDPQTDRKFNAVPVRLVVLDPSGQPIYLQADASGVLQVSGGGGGGGGGTVTQGTPAALAGAWPVIATDGVHQTPTADAPARALQVTPGDGTNVTPAGDAVGRARFNKLTDGVSTAAVKAASTAAIATDPALVVALSPNGAAVKVTDGANFMPTGDTQARALNVILGDGAGGHTMPAGDVAARAGFEKITDGTNTAAVKAASTAPIATDPALVVALSPNTPLPAALVGGRLDENVGSWLGSTAPSVGSKTSANSVPVVIASDQASVPVTGVGTAAAAADGVANPTLGLLQSILSGFNGTTWDRIRAGVVGVQTTFVGLLNTISMARYNATPPTLADGNMAPLQANTTGALKTVTTDVETAILDLTTTTSSSASTTTVSATVTGLSKITALSIEATLQGNTGGVLDIYLQHSPNGGTDWYDYAHYTQLAAAAAATTQMYVPGINDKNTAIGKGTAGTPAVALTANSFVGGHPFDAMRMVMVTGSGTTVGKSQVVKLHVTQPKG